MSAIVREKVAQAVEILDELGWDLWLTLVRESHANPDPLLPLIYDGELTWLSALLVARGGERIAIVGHFDADRARESGAYGTVLPYHESIRPLLREQLAVLDPARIALNYAVDDVQADGLSHGLFLALNEMLAGTPYPERLHSAAPLASRLRGRKTPAELERIRAAVACTERIYARTREWLRVGQSEREISNVMRAALAEAGADCAWDPAGCPTVSAGAESPVGHTAPSDLTTRPGQLLHLDFGAKLDGFCADIQRVVYFLGADEQEPPERVVRAFTTVRRAIEAARAALRPGAVGHEVDAVARRVVREAGYPEYMYATGHQMGREVHDGGTLLGPRWPRYGATPEGRVEAGQVYTLELGVEVVGIGYLGLEEDVVVSADGADYLSRPQRELWLR